MTSPFPISILPSRVFLLAFGLCVAYANAIAAPVPVCKARPDLVGACYVVHGRAAYSNGTPALRIWIVGTKRMLGVTSNSTADDADEPVVPEQLKFDPSEKAFGDFEVCPFTPQRSGAMQMVCVASVKNFSLR